MSHVYTKIVELGGHPASEQIFLSVEGFRVDGPEYAALEPERRAPLRMTVSHPEPDCHIAVALTAREALELAMAIFEALKATGALVVAPERNPP